MTALATVPRDPTQKPALIFFSAGPPELERLRAGDENDELRGAVDKRFEIITIFSGVDEELRRALTDCERDGRPTILHVSTHGRADDTTGEASLIFESLTFLGSSVARPVTSKEFARFLATFSCLRLVTLSACDSWTIARDLREAGSDARFDTPRLPAVVGVQGEVRENIARDNFRAFYGRLRADKSVREALPATWVVHGAGEAGPPNEDAAAEVFHAYLAAGSTPLVATSVGDARPPSDVPLEPGAPLVATSAGDARPPSDVPSSGSPVVTTAREAAGTPKDRSFFIATAVVAVSFILFYFVGRLIHGAPGFLHQISKSLAWLLAVPTAVFIFGLWKWKPKRPLPVVASCALFPWVAFGAAFAVGTTTRNTTESTVTIAEDDGLPPLGWGIVLGGIDAGTRYCIAPTPGGCDADAGAHEERGFAMHAAQDVHCARRWKIAAYAEDGVDHWLSVDDRCDRSGGAKDEAYVDLARLDEKSKDQPKGRYALRIRPDLDAPGFFEKSNYTDVTETWAPFHFARSSRDASTVLRFLFAAPLKKTSSTARVRIEVGNDARLPPGLDVDVADESDERTLHGTLLVRGDGSKVPVVRRVEATAPIRSFGLWDSPKSYDASDDASYAFRWTPARGSTTLLLRDVGDAARAVLDVAGMDDRDVLTLPRSAVPPTVTVLHGSEWWTLADCRGGEQVSFGAHPPARARLGKVRERSGENVEATVQCWSGTVAEVCCDNAVPPNVVQSSSALHARCTSIPTDKVVWFQRFGRHCQQYIPQ